MGFDVLLRCLSQRCLSQTFSLTDLTRECTLQEFTVFAKSQFPHFDVLDSQLNAVCQSKYCVRNCGYRRCSRKWSIK